MDVKTRLRQHKTDKRGLVSRAYKKHGLENFEIYVEYFPNLKKDDLLDLEEQLIKKFDSLSPNGYNICPRGQNSTGHKHSEESKRKMSEANKGKKRSPEYCLQHSLRQKGKKLPQSTKDKMSLGHLGKKHSEEAKENMSKAQKGKVLSEETKNKLSKHAKSLPNVCCPHCGKSLDPRNAKKWHFDNCKLFLYQLSE